MTSRRARAPPRPPSRRGRSTGPRRVTRRAAPARATRQERSRSTPRRTSARWATPALCHGRRRARRARAGAPGARPDRQVPVRVRRLDVALDAFQAVVLSHKLPLLERWNEQRRQAAHAYGEALQGSATYGRPRPSPAPSTSGTCTRSGRRSREPCCPLKARHRQRAPLPGAAAPVEGVRRPRLRAGLVPGRRGDRAGDPFASALPRDHRGADRPRRLGDRGLLRAWLTRRPTTRRSG